MTDVSQFDLHPDAELLSAFAEQALGQDEYATVLTHLAACNHCRQILFLANEAANEDAAFVPQPQLAALEPEAQPEQEEEGAAWLLGLRRAWMPLCTLALAVLTTAVVHQLRNRSTSEAQLQPPPAPVISQTQAENPVAAGEKSITAAPQHAPTISKSSPQRPPAPPPALPSIEATKSVVIAESWPQPAAGPPSVAADVAPSQNQYQNATFQAETVQVESALRTDKKAAPVAVHGRVASAGAPQPNAFSDVSGLAAKRARLQTMVVEANAALTLPGGRRAASLAQGTTRTLALDEKGTLFVTLDHGSHWQQLPAAWSGRAVAIRAQHAAAVSAESTKAPVTNAPEETFELTNDQGRTWISNDGLTWRPRSSLN